MRTKTQLPWMFAIAMAVACVPRLAAAAELELGELRFFRGAEKQAGIVLRADGKIQDAGGKLVGSLTRDGRALDQAGKEVARITPKGTLTAGGKPVATLTKEGVLDMDGARIELDKEGKLTGMGDLVVRVEGVTPKTRRAAMFVLTTWFSLAPSKKP